MQLLKDLKAKEVERKAKFDKISDYEAYLASVSPRASDKGEADEAAITTVTSKEDDQANKNLPSLTEDHDIVLEDTSVTKIDNDPDNEEDDETIDKKHDNEVDVGVDVDDADVEQNGEEANDENQQPDVDVDVDVKQENNNGFTMAVVHISRT